MTSQAGPHRRLQKKIFPISSSFFLKGSSEFKMENPTQNKIKRIRKILLQEITNAITALTTLNVTKIPSTIRSLRKKNHEEEPENAFTRLTQGSCLPFKKKQKKLSVPTKEQRVLMKIVNGAGSFIFSKKKLILS